MVIDAGRALLIRRASPPLEDQWSIPGGMLELGETLDDGLRRELAEETGLEVAVVELIEALERIEPGTQGGAVHPASAGAVRPRYHFVILDYLCEARGGVLRAGSDAKELAWARENELEKFNLTAAATRVLKKAFAIACARAP